MFDEQQFEVLVVGSTMIDLTTYSRKLPIPGETLIGDAFEMNFGGKGGNQAVQAARLGVKVSMMGMIGCDDMGVKYKAQFTTEGIENGKLLTSSSSGTGTASIFVDRSGNNSIIIVPGANLELNEKSINENRNVIANANVLICQNEISLSSTKCALSIARDSGTISILNPAPANSDVKELVELVDIVCPNEIELATLTGLSTTTDEEVETSAKQLLSRGCKYVVVTLGSRGACIVSKNLCEFISAPKVTAIDTVGAGDSFIGTLAANISRGSDIIKATKNAVHCASISVTRKGSQKSCVYLHELDKAYYPPTTSAINTIFDKKIIRQQLSL